MNKIINNSKKIKFSILVVIMLLVTVPTMVFATENNSNQTNENQNTSEKPDNSNNNEEASGNNESDKNTSETVIEVTSISFTKEKLTLVEGEDEKLTVKFDPSDATDKTITWTTSDKDIATVSDKGVVTAVKKGTAIIKATSNNGKVVSCEITVTEKKVEKSSDYSLKSLTITNGTLDKEFNPDVYEYNVTVDNTVSELNFDWKFNDDKAKYLISNNNSIRTGQIVKFLPIAENGSKGKEYKFIIKKEEANLNLKSLTIKGYSLNETFSPEKLEYTADIPFEAVDVTIQTATEDDNASVKVKGATSLIVGRNTVVVTVTDTSGNEREYKITVTRLAEEDREVTGNSSKYTSATSDNLASSNVTDDDTGTRSNHLLRYIFVTLGCVILFAIGVIGIYFYIITSTKNKKKKNKKNNISNSEEEMESPLVETTIDKKTTNKKIEEVVEKTSEELEKTIEFYDKDLNDIKEKNNNEIRKDIEELLDD